MAQKEQKTTYTPKDIKRSNRPDSLNRLISTSPLILRDAIMTTLHSLQDQHRASTLRKRASIQGFTLLELLLVVAIMGGLIGIGVSTFTQISNTKIRVATNKLASALRHSFGYAVSHGRYVRMVLDLDGNRYWVESSDRPIFLSAKKREENVDPNELSEEEREEVEKAKEEGRPVKERPRFTKDKVISEVKLEKGITLRSVFTANQDEVFSAGKAYVHFFPNGFAEPAMITIGQGEVLEEGGTYTLVLSPLTGKVKREVGTLDPDRYFGEPDKVEEEGR